MTTFSEPTIDSSSGIYTTKACDLFSLTGVQVPHLRAGFAYMLPGPLQ